MGDFGIARILEGTVDYAKTCIGTPYYFRCIGTPYYFRCIGTPYNFRCIGTLYSSVEYYIVTPYYLKLSCPLKSSFFSTPSLSGSTIQNKTLLCDFPYLIFLPHIFFYYINPSINLKLLSFIYFPYFTLSY